MAKTTVGAGTRKRKPQISMIEIDEITKMLAAPADDIGGGGIGGGGGGMARPPGGGGSCPTRMCWRCDPPDPCPGPACW